MAAKRIYEVLNKETGVCALVRASSRAQAVGHVSRNAYDVQVATQEALVAAMGDGVKVEDAAAE